MNRSLLFGPVAFGLAPLLFAQSSNEPPPPPPPVAQALPRTPAPGLPSASPSQRVYGPTADTLIARTTAEGIIDGFRRAYKSDSAPRVVIYVNRALVDTVSGLKLTARSEQFEKTEAALKSTGTNAYQVKAPASPTLADQQTVREIERLFGRAFRHAGAQLADQNVAASLLPEQPGAHLVGDRAEKDRQALANIADIAIEILISSRSIVVPEVAGDTTYPVPDIQATAIRLKDAAIVGQAAASDIVGRGTQAGRVVRQFSVQDITEATALALMEDMLTGKR
ncbi:MAG: hypothetical protein HZC55_00970 [Verrucomicrobia bacterium]|nr:hypothetical protein [Verrucomicrobiota bacterium]